MWLAGGRYVSVEYLALIVWMEKNYIIYMEMSTALNANLFLFALKFKQFLLYYFLGRRSYLSRWSSIPAILVVDMRYL